MFVVWLLPLFWGSIHQTMLTWAWMHSLLNSYAQGCSFHTMSRNHAKLPYLITGPYSLAILLFSSFTPHLLWPHLFCPFRCCEVIWVLGKFSCSSYSKNVVLLVLSSEIELKLHNQHTHQHSVPCSSMCMWQGTGVYTPLLLVLLSLNLFLFLWIFPVPFFHPFLAVWTCVDTFHCLSVGLDPVGNS